MTVLFLEGERRNPYVLEISADDWSKAIEKLVPSNIALKKLPSPNSPDC